MSVREIVEAVADRFRDTSTGKVFPKAIKVSPLVLSMVREEMMHDPENTLLDSEIKTQEVTLLLGGVDVPLQPQTSWAGFRVEGSAV
jgi:hypothetical protein